MSVVVLQLMDQLDFLISTLSDSPSQVFVLPRVLDMWREVLGWNGIVIRSGESLVIGFEKSTPVGKLFFSMPFGGYGGLVGKPNQNEADEIFNTLESRNYLQKNLVQFEVGAVYPNYYRINRLATHIVDLSSHTTEYAENVQRNLRKASEKKVIVQRSRLNLNSAVLDLLRVHQRRTGEIRRLPVECYKYLLNNASEPKSDITVNCALIDSTLVAAHIYFVSRFDAFYFDGFSSQLGLDSGANFVLMDYAMRQFRDGGVKRFNLGATPAGDTGLERFKTGWGADRVEYTEYVRRSRFKELIDLMTRQR